MKRVILYITGLIVLSSCVEEQQFSNTARGNFEACWKIINDRYCFFEYKNVDWDEVYDRYEKKIESPMQVDSLFYLLSDML